MIWVRQPLRREGVSVSYRFERPQLHTGPLMHRSILACKAQVTYPEPVEWRRVLGGYRIHHYRTEILSA